MAQKATIITALTILFAAFGFIVAFLNNCILHYTTFLEYEEGQKLYEAWVHYHGFDDWMLYVVVGAVFALCFLFFYYVMFIKNGNDEEVKT